MSDQHGMAPARRRPIPGMAPVPAPPPPRPIQDPRSTENSPAAAPSQPRTAKPRRAASERSSTPPGGRARSGQPAGEKGRPERRPAADYAATRLVNFRIPVDLHDRYKQLVHEAERQHPRLRRPSLTELIIALLEEGPGTADEVAELIRRTRAGEHETELRT
jgi:hypothetical protein